MLWRRRVARLVAKSDLAIQDYFLRLRLKKRDPEAYQAYMKGRQSRQIQRSQAKHQAQGTRPAKRRARMIDDRSRQFSGTPEGFYLMFLQQRGRCFLCRKPFSAFMGRDMNIDHCHESGKVRGLLCPKCNQTLGHIEKRGWDVRAFVQNLEAYLSPKS